MVRLGKTRLESVTVTAGATILSDPLSLVVFAVCVPVFQSGFAMSGLVVQIIELTIFFPLIVMGLGRLGS